MRTRDELTTAAAVFPLIRALAHRPEDQQARKAAFAAYARLVQACDLKESQELSALCGATKQLARTYYELLQLYVETDPRFERQRTRVLGLVFRLHKMSRFTRLLFLPEDPRADLQRHLETASMFPGDIHLSTVGLMLPARGLMIPPDFALGVVQRSTNGRVELPFSADMHPEDDVEAFLVVFATLHISEPDEGEAFDEACEEMCEVAYDYEWDLTHVCAGKAEFERGGTAIFALGRVLTADTLFTAQQGIERLVPISEKYKAKLVLQCVSTEETPAKARGECAGGRTYDINIKLLMNNRPVANYPFGITNSPAFILGHVLEVLELLGIPIELEHGPSIVA